MKLRRCFWTLAILLVAWRLFLYIFMMAHVPGIQVAPDSDRYLKLASTLASRGAFVMETADGVTKPEVFRTPGYPLFLAALRGVAGWPVGGITLLQVFLTFLVAWIVYKTAMQIDEKIAYLSTLIVLCDPVSSIISLRLMTETVFLSLIAVFYFSFVRYLKSGKIGPLLLAGLMTAAATYVHAIGYYFGAATALFMIYANVPKDWKKNAMEILVFLAVVYGLVGLWQFRNFMCCRETAFSSVIEHNFRSMGLLKVVHVEEGWLAREGILSQLAHDLYAFLVGCFTHLFRPVSFKYFDWRPLHKFGNVFSYVWTIFCATGLAAAIFRTRKNLPYQFLLWSVIYFCSAAVLSAYKMAEARMRMPFLPCVAILSAYGWSLLWPFIKKKILKKTDAYSGSLCPK